jgi:hypothetical protein
VQAGGQGEGALFEGGNSPYGPSAAASVDWGEGDMREPCIVDPGQPHGALGVEGLTDGVIDPASADSGAGVFRREPGGRQPPDQAVTGRGSRPSRRVGGASLTASARGFE